MSVNQERLSVHNTVANLKVNDLTIAEDRRKEEVFGHNK